MDPNDDSLEGMPSYLSLEQAARIFAGDLPALCDAQLVRVLAEAQQPGSLPVAAALAPLARSELSRRRAANPRKP